MSRKIKFRAWDTEDGRMFNVFRLDMGFMGRVWENKGLPHERFDVELGLKAYHPSRVHLMQYTGLKDKNGVEIYVGDIVRDLSFNSQLGQTAGEVVFENGCYWVKDGQMLGGKNYQAVVEVVGNIYQHPIRLAKFNKENND